MRNDRMSADERATRRQWESFVGGNDADLKGLAPAIRAAWLRSRDRGTDPRLSRAPLVAVGSAEPAVETRHVPWRAALDPAFQLLAAALSEPHQVVLVADRDGRAVRAHQGSAAGHPDGTTTRLHELLQAAATTVPCRSVNSTGRQSATITVQAMPRVVVTAASASNPFGVPASSTATRVPCTCRMNTGRAPSARRSTARLLATATGASPTWSPRFRLS